MSTHLKVFIGLIIAGALIIAGIKFVAPVLRDKNQKNTSDARATKGTIVQALDNWIGYFPAASQEMKKRMRRSGYLLETVNDNANYAERMEKLRRGEYQFAMATVDSYLLNGAAEGFPATIIAVIDESSGGDAVVAWKNKVSGLDGLKEQKGVKVAFTPASPSEHLLKSMAVHFDIPLLKQRDGAWRLTTNGSEEALRKLLKKEADMAVIWEPDVSKAMDKGKGEIVKLLGTEDTEKLIVDVLLVNRKFAKEYPEVVAAYLRNYFRTLKYYRDNPEEFIAHCADDTDLGKGQVVTMLKGVNWVNLADNSQKWFGLSSSGAVAEEGLIDTIEAAVQILIDSGDFQTNPLPNNDPYRLTNSRFVADLHDSGMAAGQIKTDVVALPGKSEIENSLTRKFPSLSESGWNSLREVGTLKVRHIVFQSGTADLRYDDKLELDKAVENLRHYPNFRIIIKGHTSLAGDPRVNKALSQARAKAVKRYLTVTYGIDDNRLRAVGYGSEKPLSRLPGESKRAYYYRLPRVELFLASEVF